jgi:hypothetical protein
MRCSISSAVTCWCVQSRREVRPAVAATYRPEIGSTCGTNPQQQGPQLSIEARHSTSSRCGAAKMRGQPSERCSTAASFVGRTRPSARVSCDRDRQRARLRAPALVDVVRRVDRLDRRLGGYRGPSKSRRDHHRDPVRDALASLTHRPGAVVAGTLPPGQPRRARRPCSNPRCAPGQSCAGQEWTPWACAGFNTASEGRGSSRTQPGSAPGLSAFAPRPQVLSRDDVDAALAEAGQDLGRG